MLDDEELVVVWSGKDSLLPPRDSAPDEFWVRPKRLYNMRICKVCGGFVYKCKKFGHIPVVNTPPSGGGNVNNEKENV